jgi:hypothetical protein
VGRLTESVAKRCAERRGRLKRVGRHWRSGKYCTPLVRDRPTDVFMVAVARDGKRIVWYVYEEDAKRVLETLLRQVGR